MSSMTQGSDDDAHRDEPDLASSDSDSDSQREEAVARTAITNGDDAGHDPAAAVFDDGERIEDDESVPASSSSHNDGREDSSLPHNEFSTPTRGRDHGVLSDAESIPDDSPSVQGSPLSSRSSAVGPRRSPSNVSIGSHRPFDLRFQTRLSTSLPSSTRPVSPSLLHAHSRHSSLASHIRSGTPDLQETPPAPWEVVRWTKLKKITGQVFSEVGKRNFGRPTSIAVSTTIAIGTSKGVILVFDYQQSLKAVIGSGTKAVDAGAVTALAISADHTTLAGGHSDGSIFTWEIARPGRPFLQVPSIPSEQVDSKGSDGHVSGAVIAHVGFLGTRHTALVSADDHGMAFSHLATRGMGAVGRVVRTTRILGRYPENTISSTRKPSAVLAFSPLPLGNVTQSTDSLGLVAMLTPYLLVIVSTTPVARTQHKSGRPKEVAAHSAMTAALAWFPSIKLKGQESETSRTKLVYCWSNVLTILEVFEVKSNDSSSDASRPPRLEFKPRSRWRAEEPIVAVQWISRSVLAVMTITQRLLILEDKTLQVTDSFDLLHKHIYHVDLFSSQLHSLVEQLDEEDPSMHGVVADAFYMSFRAYKGRLFLLGFDDVCVGSLSNWADRLLALMEAGDFIAAIQLATAYYKGDTEKLTVGLPEEDPLRHELVREKLLEMMLASLKYAFGKREDESDSERTERMRLSDLAEVCIAACNAMGDYDFLFDQAYSWYEECGADGVFLDVLEPYIVQGSVRTLPPPAVKSLITHFATNHTATRLEEIICLLDTSTIDIDQVTSLCKELNLYDAYIYVWNRTLRDYIGPLKDLLALVSSWRETGSASGMNGEADLVTRDRANATKVFPYLSYILTGRIYPTGDEMDDSESSDAKTAIYRFLFSGTSSSISNAGDAGGRSARKARPSAGETSFEELRAILEFDTPSFMSMLNEAFEDSYLNDGAEQTNTGAAAAASSGTDGISHGLTINRQYLISILLEIMDPSSGQFAPVDTIYLDMFIARNLPKYPQYILLSGSTLQQVLVRLCKYPKPELLDDCQLSAEYLLSTYHPPDIQGLVPLFREARFFRVLKSTYRAEKQYPELLLTYLEDPEDQEAVFDNIYQCLRPRSTLTNKQRRDAQGVVKNHAAELARINVIRAAKTVQSLSLDLHSVFVQALDGDADRQYQYLDTLFEPEWKAGTATSPATRFDQHLIERYVSLMCQYEPSQVSGFVDRLSAGELHLETVLPDIESSGIVDAAVILLARQGEVSAAMDRLTKHLGSLEAGLLGILESLDESPDSDNTAEAVKDLIDSLTKYTRVGIWLCQEQTKAARKTRRPPGKFTTRSTLSSSSPSSSLTQSPFDQPLAFDENLWLSLIDAVVKISQNVAPLLSRDSMGNDTTAKETDEGKTASDSEQRFSASLRSLVHQVFTALLASTSARSNDTPSSGGGKKTDVAFLRVLRAFLSRAAAASPSLSELRSVIGSIFAAYTYEESLLSLANSMLDKDLFVHVDEITKLRQRGWRPRGQVCEVCRRRVWGPGSGRHVWTAWEKKQSVHEDSRRTRERAERSRSRARDGDGDGDGDRERASRGKGKAAGSSSAEVVMSHKDADAVAHDDGGGGGREASGPAVVFGCRHVYHGKCLGEECQRRGFGVGVPGPGHRQQHRDGEFFCLSCNVHSD